MAFSFFQWLRGLFGLRHPARGVSPFPPGKGPARLLILRHGEKTGAKHDKSLSAAGFARAEKLATYIPQTFGTPDFLIAASNSGKSRRPYETLEPLAKAQGLAISADLDDEQVDELVDALASPAYAGKFGVISWRHSDLSRLIGALGAPEGTYPRAWDENVYDLSVEIDYRNGAAPPLVHQIRQPF